jgi:hypothetical protein
LKALSRAPVFLPAVRRAVVNMGQLGSDIDPFPTREWIPVFHQGTALTLLARVWQVHG